MPEKQDRHTPLAAVARWLDHIDPGVHRRSKGLRLITAFGIAAMLGTLGDIRHGLPDTASLSLLAGNFALWASVSEARATRACSSRDLVLLSAAAAVGAASFAILAPLLAHVGRAGPELVLVSGAFCVGCPRRFDLTGTGIGSQIYIGQPLAYGVALLPPDLPTIAAASTIAIVASVVPRVLSGSAEHPPPQPAPFPRRPGALRPELVMGLQAGTGALLIVVLNALMGMVQSAWAITACTYVIADSSTGTIERVRRRIIGTMVGVPVALAFLPLAPTMLVVVLVGCGTGHGDLRNGPARAIRHCLRGLCFHSDYAFTLIVTLAVAGEHSISMLAARAKETLLGGVLGPAAATLLLPLRPPAPTPPTGP